jgi:hypothetical protein
MMALSKKLLDQEPGEIELLLPWHAAGTLSARDARRVEEALARQYAVIREEYAETIDLNESLGAPSVRAIQNLFAAIDAEPAQEVRPSFNLSTRISNFFASLSPRALAWSAGVGAVALLLQAGVIGAVLIQSQGANYQTASLSTGEHDVVAQAPPRALVRFAPDARMADITALLDTYQASIIGGAKGGMFRLQFGDKPVTKQEASSLLNRLQGEKIVSLAVATP